MKEVAQRCWTCWGACWGAQRASKKPKKLQGGILDSSMVCALIPDLWGDRAKRREKRKKYVARWLAQESYRVHSGEAKRLLRKDFKKKLAPPFEKLAPPWEWRQCDTWIIMVVSGSLSGCPLFNLGGVSTFFLESFETPKPNLVFNFFSKVF